MVTNYELTALLTLVASQVRTLALVYARQEAHCSVNSVMVATYDVMQLLIGQKHMFDSE